MTSMLTSKVGFIGGGHMAQAIIAGLLKRGFNAASIEVFDPSPDARCLLNEKFEIQAQPEFGNALSACATVVWAVKPQNFPTAASQALQFLVPGALHLSIMAGVDCAAIGQRTAARKIVRAMPNIAALIGEGVSGLFASGEVNDSQKRQLEELLSATGDIIWVEDEAALDSVTAISGSGPAYVIYFMEAALDAAIEMGLTAEQGRALVLATFRGTSIYAAALDEPLDTLRLRVTSRGGTTEAAIRAMNNAALKTQFKRAMWAAHRRAVELREIYGSE